MTTNPENRLSCYGNLDVVFPKGDDGLRHTPDTCFLCPYKTQCLRSAMGSFNGLNVQEEFVDRAYASGMMGFLERWSKKKGLHRKIDRSRKIHKNGRKI